ncbi:MAG: DNA-directed RNA polymerase subunit H [Candidatus Aenigmarchaeota archaeon]|nr:DNA-directed RNA polymerase subunit H [Candidatus Aenigmarchaeota archaeon]
MTEKEVNILKHFLVPEHVILSDEEKKELLERLNIKLEQLPKLSHKDAVVKAIDAVERDVIKITRDSPTAGVTTYYRLVIKG